jgi:hypothetical protein
MCSVSARLWNIQYNCQFYPFLMLRKMLRKCIKTIHDQFLWSTIKRKLRTKIRTFIREYRRFLKLYVKKIQSCIPEWNTIRQDNLRNRWTNVSRPVPSWVSVYDIIFTVFIHKKFIYDQSFSLLGQRMVFHSGIQLWIFFTYNFRNLLYSLIKVLIFVLNFLLIASKYEWNLGKKWNFTFKYCTSVLFLLS